jgi:hypothetical protein
MLEPCLHRTLTKHGFWWVWHVRLQLGRVCMSILHQLYLGGNAKVTCPLAAAAKFAYWAA